MTKLRQTLRWAGRTIAAALAFTTLACSDSPTSPSTLVRESAATAQTELTAVDIQKAFETLFSTTVLERTTALPTNITVSRTIGSEGGKIEIREAGFELIIPRGAVNKPVVFTATALAGKAIAYDFGPHGMTFKKPLLFRQNSFYTFGWWNANAGGYFKSSDQVDGTKAKAHVDETLPLLWDKSWMMLNLHHFSGYLVSCA